MEILKEVIIPLVTGILGFLGGCKFELSKIKQQIKINGDNNGNIAGRDVKNENTKK